MAGRYFNPHSRKGSDWKHRRKNRCYDYFNPHSRKGSDESLDDWRVPNIISIHTPAKGVTWMICTEDLSTQISIHTPAKGVTSGPGNYSVAIVISIHTPAKGVTLYRIWEEWRVCNFNPHSRKGSDCK